MREIDKVFKRNRGVRDNIVSSSMETKIGVLLCLSEMQNQVSDALVIWLKLPPSISQTSQITIVQRSCGKFSLRRDQLWKCIFLQNEIGWVRGLGLLGLRMSIMQR